MKEKGKTNKKVTLLWGLPGSGKTHYAKERTQEEADSLRYSYQQFKTDTVRIDIDKLMKGTTYTKGLKGDKLIEKVVADTACLLRNGTMGGYPQGPSGGMNEVILDGLITTNEQARPILSAIRAELGDKVEIEIVWWQPDRPACHWNDRGRRQENSALTINTAPFEEPSQELIKEFNIQRVSGYEVQRKPMYEVWLKEEGISESKGFLVSSSWSLGGTAGNCWNDEKYHISPEAQPASFREFDELLEKIAPQISFLQYKRMHGECVTSETTSQGDYYGGSTTDAYWKCDLKKLYAMLREYGYVKE